MRNIVFKNKILRLRINNPIRSIAIVVLVLFSFQLLVADLSPVFAQEAAGDSASKASSAANLPDSISSASPVPDITQIASLTEDSHAITSAVLRTIKVHALDKKNYRADEPVRLSVEDASFSQIKIKFTGPKNETVQPRIRVISEDPAIFTILPPSNLRPGKYTVAVTDSTGKVTTQDFTWGVLAINTNKSMYQPAEKASIAMAVLNETGGMVCDAQLNLAITDPAGDKEEFSTANGRIKTNPECESKAFHLTPDYEASYQTRDEGKYAISLSATTKNGTYQIADGFEVKENAPFDVERSSATRIYPPHKYPVRLSITAKEDFEGVVQDVVPASFDVSPLDEAQKYKGVTEVSREVLGATDAAISIPQLSAPFEGNFEVTQRFGAFEIDDLLQAKYKKYGIAGHDGVDFDLPAATPVVATDDGEVVKAEKNGDYGTTVVIQHTWGKSYYGHLSVLLVEEGDKVTRSSRIALSGSTGLSTGPHLHFAIKPESNDFANGFKGKIDPAPYLGLSPSDAQVLGAFEASGAGIADEKKKVITWDVKMKKGEQITLGYQYLAPLKSPAFYQLGALTFLDSKNNVVFEEARQWQIAVDDITTIRQEINILDKTYSQTNATASSDERVQLDTTKYSGTVSYYFEVVGSATLASSGSVRLRRVGTTTDDATVAISSLGTSSTRLRSSAITPPSGQTEYFVFADNPGVINTLTLKSARIIVLQTGNPLTATESQVEIGNNETGKTNTSAAALTNPKYWKYTSANWDPAPAFYAEATYKKTDTETPMPTVYGVGTMDAGTAAVTPDLPSGTVANDMLVMFCETNNQTITASGWTEATNSPQSDATDATRLTVFWRRATGTDATTTSDSGDHQICQIVGVRGVVASGDPWDVTIGGTEITSDTTGSIPGTTTTVVNTLVLAAGSTTRDANNTINFSSWANSNLANLTERINRTTNSGAGGGMGVVSGEKATAGNYGSTTVTYATASRKGLWSGALKPALVTTPTVTIKLQEDDGSFANWTDVTNGTIVNASATSGTTVRARTGTAFTPTNGRNYRIVGSISNGTGHTYDIYNAKIIAQQASSLIKTESQYLLLNTADSGATGLQGYQTLWDSSEWAGVTNTYKYAHVASNAADSSKLQDIDNGNADITNATVTGANQQIASSAFTMPASGNQLDVNVTDTTGVVAGARILVAVSVNFPFVDQKHYRFRNDDGSETTATWLENEDAVHLNQERNINIRLRFQIANTGAASSAYNYRLEYASKGASCASASYSQVPVTATTQPFDMVTTTNYTDGDATTTQLSATGTFVAGKMVEDPSNSTGSITVAVGNYTEVEYVFQATNNASGRYCFRVTNAGTAIDAYTAYPELGMSGPTLDQLMRHGKWFSGGVEQPFTF